MTPEQCISPRGAAARRRLGESTLAAVAVAFWVFQGVGFGADLYVSASDGDDGNAGTLLSPLATISAAANRALPGDTVHIREGVYRETVVMNRSGTEAEPIVFQAHDGGSGPETVVISAFESVIADTGGVGSWQQHDANIWKIQLPATADLGEGVNTVLVDGQPRINARWPNAPAAFHFDHRIMATNEGYTYDKDTAHYHPSDPGIFRAGSYNDSELPVMPDDAWVGALMTMNPGKGAHLHTGVVTSSYATTLEFLFQPIKNDPLGDSDPYFIWNTLVALDSPDEAYFDSSADVLYLWNPSALPPAGAVETKQRLHCIDIGPAAHLEFRNLTLLGGAVICRSLSSHASFDRIRMWYGGAGQSNRGSRVECFELKGNDLTVSNCDIHDSWSGGIQASGERHVLENNVVTGCYQFGIATWSGHEVQVHRNTLGHSARMNVAMYATSSSYTHNRCYLAGMNSSDEGSMNTNFNGDAQDCLVAYNWIHDNISRTGDESNGGKGIRLDSGTGGVSNYLIHHNIIWNISGGKGMALWALSPGMENYGDAKIRAYHNTVIGDLRLQSDEQIRSIAGFDIRNNIFAGILKYKGQDVALATVESNLEYEATTARFPGDVLGDADFVSVATRDYSLGAGSAAIDIGQNIPALASSYAGTAPDAGAMEYNTTSGRWTAGATVLPGDFGQVQYEVVVQASGKRHLLASGFPLGRIMPDGFHLRLGGNALDDPHYTYDINGHAATAVFVLPSSHPEGTQVLEVSYDDGVSFPDAMSTYVPPEGVSLVDSDRVFQQTSALEPMTIEFRGTLTSRKLVPIDIVDSAPGDLTFLPVALTVDTSTLILNGDLLPDGSNLRFRTADGSVVLQHYIESGLNTPKTLIWLRLAPGDTLAGEPFYMAFEEPGTPDASDPSIITNRYPVLQDPSLALWISANSVAADTSDLFVPHGSVPDLSPQGNSVSQGNAAKRPILAYDETLGLSFLTFDGTDDHLLAGTISPNAVTRASVLVVWRNGPVAEDNDRLLSSGPSGVGETFSLHAGATRGSWQIADRRSNCDSLAQFTIGKKAAKNKWFFNGDIAELLVYDIQVETGEWTKLKEYAARKYGFDGAAQAVARPEDALEPPRVFVGGVEVVDYTLSGNTIQFVPPVPAGGAVLPALARITVESGGVEVPGGPEIIYFEPGYDAWAASLPAGDRAPGLDLDADGLTNLFEYFSGLDPLTPDAPSYWMERVGTEGGSTVLGLFYYRNPAATDVLATLETRVRSSGTWSQELFLDLETVLVHPAAGGVPPIWCLEFSTASARRRLNRIQLNLIDPVVP